MARHIKRYESRKLYDTEESRYVSLDEVAAWIRAGEDVVVTDNGSSEDVTVQTLTQIILDQGRKGSSRLSSDFLHDLVRRGEAALSSGVEQVQSGMDRFVRASFDRLGPVREVRQEMSRLRARLDELEVSLAQLDTGRSADSPGS